jgi:RNA polymerase sigma-70 factor (ECF subfamily)
VQDAYLKAIENENVFEFMNEYQIKGWFFVTIKNKNIDYIRKHSKILSLIEYENIVDTEDFEENIAMKELLSKLPGKYKDVLYLKYFHGLNSKEIGKRLGISPSTVRSQLSTSLKLLKENL